jgi:DtxR family Mn-dependent transcriptional regulator
MNDKISPTIEDYLGAMFVLERDGEPILGVRLAELLGVSPPTVTNTLKRMLRDGLVTIDSEHKTALTEPGRTAASTVMRRHMLAEWMIARMVSWAKLHKEAHVLEHALSSEVEAALVAELHDPEVCPHGNPLPGHEDAVASWIPLTQAPLGVALVIRRIHEFAEGNQPFMLFLEENLIEPGQEITIKEVLAFNQTLNVLVNERAVSLGFAVARYLFVELTAENQASLPNEH